MPGGHPVTSPQGDLEKVDILLLLLTEIQFIYNVVLILGVQQSDSGICIYILYVQLFHILFNYDFL